MKMFNLVNVGERAGSGIPNIYAVWKNEGWDEPQLEERFSPDRTILSLPTGDNEGEPAINTGDKTGDKSKASDKTSDNGDEQAIKRYGQAISRYLSKRDSCKASDIAALLELSPSRARNYLAQLVEQGVLIAEGSNKNRTYRLKK